MISEVTSHRVLIVYCRQYRNENSNHTFSLLFVPATIKLLVASCLSVGIHLMKVIYPDSFIDNMEKAGILSELTCSIINEVVVNFDGENKFNGEDFILHVNVAPSLLHNKKFISTCINAAKKNNLSLVLELTEQYFFTVDSKTISTFHCLKESGVQFALDDFGTGYSNLFYLKYFTVDFIKVDKMFTQDLEGCKQSRYIIEAILELSRKLNIKTIVEGVETMELVNKLMLLGVDYFQGYYFGQAIELCSFIREYRKTV